MADKPRHDTTAFLDEFRTGQISLLLTAAVAGFDIGGELQREHMTFDELRRELELPERSAIVLLTGLRSIGLIDIDGDGKIFLTDYGFEKLAPESKYHLRGYIGLGAFSADTQSMIQCLRNDRPAGDVSFVYHEDGPTSALDDPDTADLLTRAMADRARNVAPFVAEQLDLSKCRTVVDVGGGHGLYSFELLKRFPDLNAVVIDREPALRVARTYAEAEGLLDRVELLHGDIFTSRLSRSPDAVLMANILHDYNDQDAERLVRHFADQLAEEGRLMILDAFLNSVGKDQPPIADGPRAVAAYSALLFSICEGRCYREDELRSWLANANLQVDDEIRSVPAHGSVMTGWKR